LSNARTPVQDNQFFKYHDGMGVALETSRLLMREIDSSNDDLIQYLGWLQDVHNNSFIQSARVDYRMEELVNFIDSINSNSDALLLGLFLRKESHFIGTLKVEPIDYSAGSAWLGIMIGNPKFRGLGYGREAMEKVLSYLFDFLKLQAVYLGVDLENLSAINLYKKLGFREYELNANSMFMKKTETT
jgi:RimJ/RimL family protein N-acetyltransferase